ncbi:MAG: hypothetical protein PQJ47_06945 [Sphaerochaetaceae bacterium]|nr:hypothetical protein [Sphaerochaetaceae bacterium]
MGTRMRKYLASILIFSVFVSLSAQMPQYANASERAFPFLEALDVLDTMSAIDSLSYVVSEISVRTIVDNDAVIADTLSYPPFISIASAYPSFIFVDEESFPQLLVKQKVVVYPGVHPLFRLQLILKFGRIFGRQKMAVELYEKEKEEYQKLLDYLSYQKFEKPQVTLFSEDEYLEAFFIDAGASLSYENNPPSTSIIFSFDGRYYSFDKRENGSGYSDVNSSAVIHPHYLLSDIITLLYSGDRSSLTYIEEVSS